MRTAEIYHKIDELKYSHSLRSPKILTVHKVLFEDELGDSVHKRKNAIKREEKKPHDPTTELWKDRLSRFDHLMLLREINSKIRTYV